MFRLLRRSAPTPRVRTPLGDVSYRHLRNSDERSPLLVALHGYGANASQIAGLLPITPSRSSHLVAPEAFLTLRDGGRAWFPLGTRNGDPHVDPAYLKLALERLDATLLALHRKHCTPGTPLVLIGYSQGAALVLEWLRENRKAPVTHAAAFSGKPVLPAANSTRRFGIPVFIANGKHDPLISEADHWEAVEAMTALGHTVEARRDAVPHVVSRAAVRGLAQWLDAELASAHKCAVQPTNTFP